MDSWDGVRVRVAKRMMKLRLPLSAIFPRFGVE